MSPSWNRLNTLTFKETVLKSNQENQNQLALRDWADKKFILYRNVWIFKSFLWYFLGNHLHKYSKVLDPTQLGAIETVPLPECPAQAWSKPDPLNITAPENLHKQRWLLSVNLDQVGDLYSFALYSTVQPGVLMFKA